MEDSAMCGGGGPDYAAMERASKEERMRLEAEQELKRLEANQKTLDEKAKKAQEEAKRKHRKSLLELSDEEEKTVLSLD